MIGLAAEFRLLGDVEARVAERPVTVGHARQRAVLVTLLIEVNRSVSVDQLVDRVWAGHRLPAEPINALRTYISLLRRVLGGSGDVEIVRQSAGYRLTVDPAAIDLHLFHRLVAQAREATSDNTAIARFEQALRLWRGEPFAGLDTIWFNTVRAGLVEARRSAQFDLVDVRLRLGQHAALVAELSNQVAENPLDEGVAGQLMLALYRCGRQADALVQHEQIRRRLADELGAVPSEPLQDLHRAILTADPALRAFGQTYLAAPAGDEGSSGGPAEPPARAASIPAQLPADVAAFAGRAAELATLDSLTRRAANNSGTAVVISAISGTAGVGKTALAVHWAHRVADRFPDGQLYVDLRGYHPNQPTAATDALAAFLTALGVGEAHIPLGENERAARYRTEVAGRRMLIVLDNAATVEQVRPLLPGTGTSAVLVTSRDSLAGLVARDGARRLSLDLLPPADAHALLSQLIGPQAEMDPDAVATLADLCDRLPLALRVAAELAISRPNTALADLVRELADQQQRLDFLDPGGDPLAAVAAVFSWSMRHLPGDAVRGFRLTGLHPGADLDVYAAAALIGSSVAVARRSLDSLTRAHLLHHTATGRYGMHDLLRAYAARLATAEDHRSDSDAALDRVCDYYLTAAATAVATLYPTDTHLRPPITQPTTPVPGLTDPDTARRWLDTERSTLVAVAAHTAAHGRPTHTVRLAATLQPYLDTGHNADAVVVHGHAHEAAVQTGDRTGQGQALLGLGKANLLLGDYATASELFQRALDLFWRAGDSNEVRALILVGVLDAQMGRHKTAAGHFQRAVDIGRQLGDHTSQTNALNHLGILEALAGSHETAAGHFGQALDNARKVGDVRSQARALCNLGSVSGRMGNHAAAANHGRQAHAFYRQLGDRAGQATTLDNLGHAQTRLGHYSDAATSYEQALAIFREIGERIGEVWALNGTGELCHATGDTTGAIAHHTAALAIAAEIGDLDQQARAHTGLGHAHGALKQPEKAVHHYELALAINKEHDPSQAADIRERIAAITMPIETT